MGKGKRVRKLRSRSDLLQRRWLTIAMWKRQQLQKVTREAANEDRIRIAQKRTDKGLPV